MDEILIENIVRRVMKEVLNEMRAQGILYEGITIDGPHRIVSFNPNNQDNVDTNDYIHPYIIENNSDGCTILSIFERKDNDEDNYDGNPLVYALKGKNNWRFANPNSDIYALFRRFVSVTTQLQRDFNTLILTPSTNDLNNRVFGYLKRLMKFDETYNTFFRKLSAEEVYNNYVDWEMFEEMIKNYPEEEKATARDEIDYAFVRMKKRNHGIFSYQCIRPLKYRSCITKSIEINYSGHSLEEYAEAVDGKDVLVFDDTVASGKTLSESAEALRELFNPRSITFLTLFSPKKSQGFENKKTQLKR